MRCWFSHTWSEWEYEGTNSCTQVKVCKDCGEKDTQIVHNWSSWREAFDKKSDAIQQLRRLVNNLPAILNERALTMFAKQVGIDYYDLAGNNEKEKLVALLAYCKNNYSLEKLLENLRQSNFLPNQIVGIQSLLADISLEDLNFEKSLENSTCLQKRECKRDGAIEFQYDHKIKRYRNKKNCDIVEVCHICGYRKFIEKQHQWSNWEYKSPNSCQLKRVCQNCDLEEFKNSDHNWTEWKWQNEKGCDIYRECQRCKEKETKKEQHQWTGWIKTENDHQFNICKHCGNEEYDISGEWIGFVQWEYGSVDQWKLSIKQRTTFLNTIKVEGILDVIFIDNGTKCFVRQEINGEINNNNLVFKSKKITHQTGSGRYNKDSFQGIIHKRAKAIEGMATSKSSKGKIILE